MSNIDISRSLAAYDAQVDGQMDAHLAPGSGAITDPSAIASLLGIDAASAVQDTQAVSPSQQTRLTGVGTVLNTPPPLPPTTLKVGSTTGADYARFNKEISAATQGGLPKTQIDTKQLLGNLLTTNTSTPAGQASLTKQVDTAFTGAAVSLNGMSEASMMAAFLELNVQNQASGKELVSNIMSLSTEARNTAIQQQMNERTAQAKALEKAEKKKKALGPLEIFVTIAITVASVAATVFTMGAAAGLLAVAASAAAFIIGGAVGGAKNGKGFDFKAAVEGASIGASITGIPALLKAAMQAMTKLLSALGLKAIAKKGGAALARDAAQVGKGTLADAGKQTSAQAATKETQLVEQAQLRAKEMEKVNDSMAQAKDAMNAAIDKGAPKVGAAASSGGTGPATAAAGGGSKFGALVSKSGKAIFGDPATTAGKLQVATNLVGATLQVTQGVSNYLHQKMMLDAKQHEANAKQAGLSVDIAQSIWEGAQDDLQHVNDLHNEAADQAVEMVNRYYRVARKAAGNISG